MALRRIKGHLFNPDGTATLWREALGKARELRKRGQKVVVIEKSMVRPNVYLLWSRRKA